MTTMRRPDPSSRPAGSDYPPPLLSATDCASPALPATEPSRVAPRPSASSAARRRAGFVPGPRHVALLADAGRHGLLTFRQAERRHFPAACDQPVHRHLKRLRDAGHLDRRVWGYGAAGEHKAAYLCTARGLRACGLDVPVARDRESVLASLPHDATVTEVAEAVLAGLAARGVAAAWTTEREPERGVDWLPREWAADAVRPDGVLRVRRPDGREERLAVEADTTQHGARRLARKCAAYREALARGVDDGEVRYYVPGSTLAAAARRRGVRRRAAPAGGPLPEGAAVYR
jgi:Replication-relaxation